MISLVGLSYAYFSVSDKQTQANTFRSGCLNITIESESDAITLSNAYPVSDVEGLSGAYYTFTIKNTCNKDTNYQINLESLNESPNSLKADYLKVALSSDTMDNLITKLGDNPTADPMITGAYESHNLYNGTIKANEAKEFTLREWIDYDVTKETGMNKTVTNKINVIARPDLEVEEKSEIKTSLVDYEVVTNLTGIELSKVENKIVNVINDTTYPFSYNEETQKYTSTNTEKYGSSSIAFEIEKEGDAKICYEVGDYVDLRFYIGNKRVYSNEQKCINLEKVGPDANINIEYNRMSSDAGDLSFSIELLPIEKLPIKYCISDKNKCEPDKDIDIIKNKLILDLNEKNQIICTKINNNVSCSDLIDIKPLTVSDILATYTKDDSRSGEINEGFTDRTPTTVYSKKDDDGDSYVFAGMLPNNWVKFGKWADDTPDFYLGKSSSGNKEYTTLSECESAKANDIVGSCELISRKGKDMYWRIIRFNGNGSMRLIYSGSGSTESWGEETIIGKNVFNNNYNDNAYVGLQYTLNEVHGKTVNSTILGEENSTDNNTLYGWYNNNIKDKYGNLIDSNVGFCSDRENFTDRNGINRGGGTGTTETYYRSNITHLKGNMCQSSFNPKLICSDENDKLKLPVGLITMDEYTLAGGTVGCASSAYGTWLFTSQYYWMMTPAYFYKRAIVFLEEGDAFPDASVVSSKSGIRPVINLKSTTLFKNNGADGSDEKPWIISAIS